MYTGILYVFYFSVEESRIWAMYRILLADNEEIFVTTLQTIFNSLPEHRVVGVLNNVDHLEEDVEKFKPDIIVMRTFFFLKNTGFTAAAKVKESYPAIKIIMMLDMAKYAHIEAAKKAGVDCCVVRSAKPNEFVSVLWRTMKGEHVFPNFSHQNMWGPFKVNLTERELEIISYLCQNMSYDAIGQTLGVSKRTVTFHVSNILSKTGHKNVTGLILESAHKGYLINWFTDAEDF